MTGRTWSLVLGVAMLAASCSSRAWVTRAATPTSRSSTPVTVASSAPATTMATSSSTTTPATAPPVVRVAPVATAAPTPIGLSPEPSPETAPPMPAQVVSAGGVGPWPAAGEVALTFDDGPGDATPGVVDVLEHYRIPATFFVVGRAVGRHHDLLARMRDDGDTVENHTWDHPHLTALPRALVRAELARTSATITAAIGISPVCFRPPYLDTDAAVVSVAPALDLRQVLANVDPADYARPDPAVIAERILSAASGRALVVGLHDGGGDRTRTVAALPAVIDGLANAGYHFVNLCAT